MLNILIIILAVILLVGLLYFEKERRLKGLVPTKTALSMLFIVDSALIGGVYNFTKMRRG